MASLADKNLPKEAQDRINQITAAAQAGDISWAQANKEANSVRSDYGANYTVSASGTTTYDDGSTIGSYKSGSQVSGGKAKTTIDNWNNNANVSFDKSDYATSYDPAKGLASIPQNKDLANKRVKSGNFTIAYNEEGRAVEAVRDGGASATSTVATTHANDSVYHRLAYEAAQRGDWDAVGRYLNQISETFGQTGTNDGYNSGMDLGAANYYEAELQNQFGYNAKNYYDQRYDQAYGAGSAAVWDATGGRYKTYNELVAARGKEYADAVVQSSNWTGNVVTGNAWGGNAPTMGGFNNPGIGSFEDFLGEVGYDQYADETQKYIRAAVQNAIMGFNRQIDDVNEDTEELARQAYIAREMGVKNLDQQLAAAGMAGGMADSQRIGLQANYENNLNDLERQRAATEQELLLAIENAKLTGDMQTAQELAGFLQQVQGQWVNYVQNQQAIANQNYWREQELAANNLNNARNWALTQLQNGSMPDAATLQAAGITQGEAQGLLNQVLAGNQTRVTGTPGATPKYTEGQASVALVAAQNGDNSPEVRRIIEGYYGMPMETVLTGYGINAGMTDAAIAQAAAIYRGNNPNVALDSLTLDQWLRNNGYAGENAQKFKAYMQEYGAAYSRR